MFAFFPGRPKKGQKGKGGLFIKMKFDKKKTDEGK